MLKNRIKFKKTVAFLITLFNLELRGKALCQKLEPIPIFL